MGDDKMMNIMSFTAEEVQLVALYMPKENRLQLIHAIVADKGNQEDMKELTERTVDKLARMTDAEFNAAAFTMAM
ncbi:MAG: hypothetical protein IJO70_00565 [Lachnospiraceae bacterium]|nr:hypothetical protein [Lachnospiraceae bacterium]